MAFKVRRGEFEDAAGIAFVHVQSWKTTYRGIVPDDYLEALDVESRTEIWKTRLLSTDSVIFVAEDKSGIAGFATGGSLRESVGHYDAEIYAIYLLEAQQRQGAGRLMTEILVGSLRSMGFVSIVVWVLEQNPSVGFYQKMRGVQVAQKTIEIGGVLLTEIAFGWPNIDELLTLHRA